MTKKLDDNLNVEPLIMEKGKKGRCAYSMPKRDIENFYLNKDLKGSELNLPDLCEIDIVRHYTRLSQLNFGLDTGMYPLGSCTMKYNPKLNEQLLACSGFSKAHPLVPETLSQGALQLIYELEQYLCLITGTDACSLQPSAGAQGELVGMLMICAFHKAKKNVKSKIIIPDTAHGTNPASASLCGLHPVQIKSNKNGILVPETVDKVMDDQTAGIMLTNPNTLGLFEENILEISQIVHSKGGQVYCDGANLNAVMGIVELGKIGVDVLHLNLHKTFSAPHGGGGPGSGPVCVKKHLIPFLPVPRIIKENNTYTFCENFPETIGRIHPFFGNFGVMVKAYAYIRTMGAKYLKKASQLAVLNANYIKECLKEVFYLPYDRPCLHECVFSDKFQAKYKITTLDICKRLMDFGFHPPTVYFPLVVNGAIMIEPTETESKESIDRLIDAFKTIANEAKDNPDILKKAPNTCPVKRLDETKAARQPLLSE